MRTLQRSTLYHMKEVTLQVRVDAELAAKLASEAKLRDVPVSQIVRERLRGQAWREVPDPDAPMVAIPSGPGTPKFVKDCPHPKNRQAQMARGKRCLDCGMPL